MRMSRRIGQGTSDTPEGLETEADQAGQVGSLVLPSISDIASRCVPVALSLNEQ